MNSNGRTKTPNGADVLRGLAAGLIGGLAASWTMNQFQALTSKLVEMEKSQGVEKKKEAPETKDEDDATVKAASAISEGISITN